MFPNLIANVIDAFRNPRASARTMMARTPDFADAGLMIVFAYLVEVLAWISVTAVIEGGFPPFSIAMRVGELGLQLLTFTAMTYAAHQLGLRAGGKATRIQIAGLIGWHSVVVASFSPLKVLGVHAAMTGQGGFLFVLAPISVGVTIWLFASFIAEAHGFKRLGPVVAATVAGYVLLGAVLALGLATLGLPGGGA